MNETEISRLLEEGLRFYAVGDPSRALEAWFKVLEADPAHPRALEYVEYVRKSYRVENDAASLAPIEGHVVGSDSSSASKPAENGASVVDLVVEVTQQVREPAAEPILSAHPAAESQGHSMGAPSGAQSGKDAGVVSEVEATPLEAVGVGAVHVGSASEMATSSAAPLANEHTSGNTSSTGGEAWQVEVSHVVESPTPPTADANAQEPEVAQPSAWGVAATMDWGDLVDDSLPGQAGAGPSVAAAAETDSVVEIAAAPEAHHDSTDAAVRAPVQVSPLPSLADVLVDESVDAIAPDAPVIAARWTTEASPAGAQDRAEHGGFEDAPLPEFNDWPIAPGGFAQQIRAGSVAVVEIPGVQAGPSTDGPVPAEAGPPPPEDAEGAFSTPSKPEFAASSLAVHEPATARHDDERAPPEEANDDAAGVPRSNDVTGANDDTISDVITPTPSSPTVDGLRDTSSATASPLAGEVAPHAPRARPASLLETSWGDLIDDEGVAAGTPTVDVGSAVSSAASMPQSTMSDGAHVSEAASTGSPSAPSIRLMPLEEHTPSSTKIVRTEEDEDGPPPPNPSELQSDDGSAPVIRMEGMAAAAPLPDGPGADVLAFPTPKSDLSSTDGVDGTTEQAPSHHGSEAPATTGDVEAVEGPVASVELSVAEAGTPPTAQPTSAEQSTSEQTLSASDVQSEPTQESTSDDVPAVASGTSAGTPQPQFRALAVDATADEPYLGVHRSSKVSDSSIVVNPAEEARRVGVSESTPRATLTTTIVQDKPARVLRFDSYEGDAVESSEGLPVVVSSAGSLAPVSLRVDLESDDTIRVTRAPASSNAHTPSSDQGRSAGALPSTTEAGNGASAPVAFGAVPTTGPDGKPASPWDAFSGESDSVDLDATPSSRSVFDDLRSDEDRQARAEPASSMTQSSALESFQTLPPLESTRRDTADTEPVDQCAALMEGARELFALGDFSGSLELVEKVLALEPENLEARGYLTKNEGTLMQMYASKLGDLRRAPRLLTKPDEVIWMNMHHRAGFLLSQVDGLMTYEDLAEISGMSRLETYRILADLVQNGVITS